MEIGFDKICRRYMLLFVKKNEKKDCRVLPSDVISFIFAFLFWGA